MNRSSLQIVFKRKMPRCTGGSRLAGGIKRRITIPPAMKHDTQLSFDLPSVGPQASGPQDVGGNLAGARARHEQALEITERLARDNPGSAEAQRDLIVAYVRMQESMQDVSCAQRALTVALRLREEGRLSPQDAWMIQDLKQRTGAGGEAAAD
jgi:hypothetical protein